MYEQDDDDGIAREPERARITAISRTTAYELERRGLFPQRVELPGRRSGWLRRELIDWANKRPRVQIKKAS